MNKRVEAYKTFHQNHQELLPLSANVDLILLLLSLKPCMRTQLKTLKFDKKQLDSWCRKYHLEFGIANYDLIYIATTKQILDEVIALDNSHESHEKKLGALLGYPECCCDKITQVGEMRIDQFEEWLITQTFSGSFQLINTYTYRHGKAFISHVPCSTTCISSLEIAEQVANFFMTHKNEEIFQPWVKELNAYFSQSEHPSNRLL